ncbi:MAG: UDP-N-acetylmuramate dehydrogenase [Bacteroidales bacterium]|jgi:UDP-N-acetylmuramate dehydrogenase|nr:UDP-N-acetylmuramate dehydrogenase [Bacteroidales bacterium]
MINLKPYHTFQTEAYCNQLFEITDDLQIHNLIDQGVFKNRFLILGGGSNLLFTQNFDGVVVKMEPKGIEVLGENSSKVYVKVAAGEDWEDLIMYCMEHDYYGVENLTGIPGKVGSSPVQNIGAYGVEVKDVIFQVHAISLETKQKKVFSNDQCCFAYRDSIFKNDLKNKWIITAVVFELSKIKQFNLEYAALKGELDKRYPNPTLQQLIALINEIRDAKLPDIKKIGSAGSFFKNPIIPKKHYESLKQNYSNLTGYETEPGFVKLAAGQLIDMAGWKGYREGDAGVYPLQALVLVNYGNATGKEIQNLYQKIQQSVLEKFQVAIVPEVNIL